MRMWIELFTNFISLQLAAFAASRAAPVRVLLPFLLLSAPCCPSAAAPLILLTCYGSSFCDLCAQCSPWATHFFTFILSSMVSEPLSA
jgi:hypothetical protein